MKQTVNLPIATASRHTADLGQPTICTTDFFTPRIIYCNECVPGDKWHIKVDGMTRCLPMYHPAYAEIKNNIRAFFVPFRTLYYRWQNWITNSKDGSAVLNNVPYVMPIDLIKSLHHVEMSSDTSQPSYYIEILHSSESERPENFDISYKLIKDAAAPDYYEVYVRFDKEGKFYWNLLQGLGYDLQCNFDYPIDDTDAYDPTAHSEDSPYAMLSALPLLAYAKLILDYFVSPRDVTHYTTLHSFLNDFYTGTASSFNHNSLRLFYACCSDINYNVDYFTSALDTPNTGNPYLASEIELTDPQISSTGYANWLETSLLNDSTHPWLNGPQISLAPNSGPTDQQYTPIITQYLDTAMHKLADLARKVSIVGLRPLDRFFTQRGIKLRSEYLNRSIYIGHSQSEFQISDVTSTGSLDDLADYKGKAINYNVGGTFDFDSSEDFGMIMLISTVVPSVRYFEGTPRYINHIKRNDFYQPEFDKLGVQGIRASELKSNFYTIGDYTRQKNNIQNDEIIGYTDRYAEYKQNCYGKLLGDFKLRGHNTGLDSWYLWRKISQRTKLDAEFRSTSDRSQYDRIFEVTDSQNDGFIQLFNIDAKASRPMSAMFDSYEWSDNVGHTVEQKINGTYDN